ncbi:MAG: diacylglycerol kinase family lipid kinase, partial [Akkermansiaceae bacterium]|nr:diacylglycerol kinase family lipid kinase [Akkermansiaceae bacterium]
MRICLIFNPNAGTAERIKDFLLQLTGDHRCELRSVSPTHSGARLAREALDDGFKRIVVAGGDGTINGVINGIAPDFDRAELAILPCGTGNDLARTLGFGPDRMAQASAAVLDARAEPLDLIRITSGPDTHYCVNVANGGFGGRVANDVARADKQRWGSLAYWMTSVSRLVDLAGFEVELAIDDRTLALEAFGVAVANGRFVGGGFPIAPRASLHDGLLDVTVVPVLPPLELMTAGLNFTLGRDDREDRIRRYQGRRVQFRAESEMPFSIDGEPTGRLDG